jgi:hypothetical protein
MVYPGDEAYKGQPSGAQGLVEKHRKDIKGRTSTHQGRQEAGEALARTLLGEQRRNMQDT